MGSPGHHSKSVSKEESNPSVFKHTNSKNTDNEMVEELEEEDNENAANDEMLQVQFSEKSNKTITYDDSRTRSKTESKVLSNNLENFIKSSKPHLSAPAETRRSSDDSDSLKK